MKTSTWKLSAALCAGLTLVLVCGTRADDSVPPCWRGNPGTTYQNWSFAVSNNPASPDIFTNPNGVPQATFTPGSFATGWKAGALGRTGLWDLGKGGQVSLAVPDVAGSPTPWKYVQVQVTFFDAPGFYLPPATSLAGATLVSSQVVNNQAYGPGVWRTQVTLWLLQPSPSAETIVLNGDPAHGLVLDQIIVDTRCPVAGAGEVAAYRPCWRGQPGTTFQQWMFGTPSSPGGITPEFASNTFGSATATLALGAFSSGYIEEDPFLGCQQGIWDLGQSGAMTLSIPNNPAASGAAYRYVTVAVTEYQDALYDASASVSVAGGTLVSRQEQPLEETAFGQWVVEQTVWRLEPPRPGSESVVVTGGENGSLIDQVVVDTLELDFAAPADIVASADPGQCSKAQVTWSLPAVDGCVVTNVVCSPTNGATFWVGTNLVSALVQDGEGGSRSLNFRVVITDNEAPTLACPADLVVPKAPGQCGALVSFSPTPSDNCSGATVTSVPASGSFFPLGLTTVTCSARDGAGNVSSPCTFQVRVVDFTGDVSAYRPCWRGQPGSTFQQWAFSVSNNPAVVAAELVTNSFGAPQASIVPGAFSAGYIDQDAFLGCRQGMWDLGEKGTMTLSIPNNPSASATAYRYVAVQVMQYRDGSVYTTNAWVAITGGTLVSRQEQSVEETAFGQWVVEQTVWRLEPLRPGSESVVVTGGENGSLIDQVVVDTLELDFTAPTDIVASADPGQCSKAQVSWSLPAVDGCVVTNVVCSPTNGATFWVGTNLVSALVQDGEGGSRSLNFRVVITDNEAPTLACPADLVVPKAPGQCGALVSFSPTPSDNCSGATVTSVPASGSFFPLGLTSVTCSARDGAGNVSSPCTFQVRVVDFTGDVPDYRPCWRGQPGSTFQQWAFSVSNNPALMAAEVVTNRFGAPQASIVPGAFSAGYIDQDAFLGCRQGMWDLGENGTMSLSIPNNPAASATAYRYVAVQVMQYRDGSVYTTNAWVAIAGGTLVSRQEQSVEETAFGQWVVEQTVWRLEPPRPGSESVVVTGGENGALIDQVVVDTLELDFTAPTDMVASADSGQCSKAHVAWSLPAVDGCMVTNVVCSPTNGATFWVGTNLVSALVQDGEGGSRSLNFRVVITDNEAPVARCHDLTVNLNGAGLATITSADIDNGSSDNCGILSLMVNPNSFTRANLGPNSVVLMAMDVHGHIATCNATVTVVERAELSVALASSANPAPLGANLVYTVTVSNGGPSTATGVVLTNYFSGGQVGFAVTNGVTGIGQGCPFPGPVSWWPAEGNATDVVDGNGGTVAGGVTYAAGRVGQAFGFDGLTGSVTVPDKPALRPASLTLEGWMKVKDVTGVHVVIGKRVGTDTADSYSIWLGSGVLFAAMADNTGSGPFLTYPEFPASSLFTVGDVVNLQSLAVALQSAADPVSQFLKANLSAPTLALLNAYTGGPAPALESALLKDLNAVIQHGSIYTPERFTAVALSPESAYILGRHPSGADLVRLNRFLIRDAYPGDFLATVFPQLDHYFHVAYTFDAASHVQALYVDGALVNSTFVNKTVAYDGHPVMIGADDNNGSPGYFYQGEVDEMTLYNRALSGTEIRAIAQAGSAGKCPTPGSVQLGNLASGATAQVSLVAIPTNCSPVFASVAVSATTRETKLMDNVAAVSVPVQDLPAGQLRLSLEPVSVNNNLLRVSWPLTCNPFVLESTLGVQAPVLWSPEAVPVQMMGNLNSVIVPATNSMQYYRVRLP